MRSISNLVIYVAGYVGRSQARASANFEAREMRFVLFDLCSLILEIQRGGTGPGHDLDIENMI